MNTTFEATNNKSHVLIVDDNRQFTRSAACFCNTPGTTWRVKKTTTEEHWKQHGVSSPISFFSICSCPKPTH